MKHSSSSALYAYWNERRGARAAPERGDIEPGAIRRALGDSFILAYDRAGGHPFRLAGTRICGLFGHELKNDRFDALWNERDRRAARDLVETVAAETAGIVAGASGRTDEGYNVDLELLLLPLRLRGATHARLIGVLAPLAVPFWLGSSPVVALTLGMHRHLGTPADQVVTTPLIAASHDGRVRHGLVVLDGGRS